jgi:hypothetical protein
MLYDRMYPILSAELVDDYDGADLYVVLNVLIPHWMHFERRRIFPSPSIFELDFGEVVWIKNSSDAITD